VSGNEVRVRWNVKEPYAGEPLTYALQNFPMLVLPAARRICRSTTTGV